jgi:hypothetical protein
MASSALREARGVRPRLNAIGVAEPDDVTPRRPRGEDGEMWRRVPAERHAPGERGGGSAEASAGPRDAR